MHMSLQNQWKMAEYVFSIYWHNLKLPVISQWNVFNIHWDISTYHNSSVNVFSIHWDNSNCHFSENVFRLDRDNPKYPAISQ